MPMRRPWFRLSLVGLSLLGAATSGAVLLRAEQSAVGAAAPSLEAGLPRAEPESRGFSKEGLKALDAEFHGLVDSGKLAGITTLIARHGSIVHFDTYGKASTATGEALKPDSIFRIASMTKPITGVAMMQLFEQGKWKMDDPVAKYIPEFANLQVKKVGGGTEPQAKPMTMKQLMSHTAGFGVNQAYGDAKLNETDLQGMIDKLKAMPLETQPGTAWDYGPSVNIQGYVVEKLSGESLDVYFAKHIFEPLGMVDTGFWVAPEKASRVVSVHTYGPDGKVTTKAENKVDTSKPSFLAGSGGLYGTAKDYARFAQALADGGVLEGKRILKPETVKLMRKNVLEPGVKVDIFGPAWEGYGFGMDFAVVLDPKAAAPAPQGVDSYWWAGIFGTWFWVDPTNDLVFVGLIQNLNGAAPTEGTPPVRDISYAATYKALTDPSK